VKVQFFWDRVGKKDANSSCWVRVSAAWAGKNWGFIQIPRIGQEVIVDFLEGDPDQPIITGRVYNADQMPPYDLPANMTQSGTLTRSRDRRSVRHLSYVGAAGGACIVPAPVTGSRLPRSSGLPMRRPRRRDFAQKRRVRFGDSHHAFPFMKFSRRFRAGVSGQHLFRETGQP